MHSRDERISTGSTIVARDAVVTEALLFRNVPRFHLLNHLPMHVAPPHPFSLRQACCSALFEARGQAHLRKLTDTRQLSSSSEKPLFLSAALKTSPTAQGKLECATLCNSRKTAAAAAAAAARCADLLAETHSKQAEQQLDGLAHSMLLFLIVSETACLVNIVALVWVMSQSAATRATGVRQRPTLSAHRVAPPNGESGDP